jgi:hypothetical protein
VFDDGGAKLNAGTYMTRTINLADASDELKVIVDLLKPYGSDVEVSYKTGQFIPRYVEVSDQVYDSYIGSTLYLYHDHDITTYNGGTTYNTDDYVEFTDGKTYISIQDTNVGNDPDISPAWWTEKNSTELKGSMIVTRNDEVSSPIRVFLRSITNIGGFLDPSDWVINGVDDVMFAENNDIVKLPAWDIAVNYDTDDYVKYSNLIWQANEANVGETPSTLGTIWSLVKSSTVDSIVIEDALQEYRPMKLEITTLDSLSAEDDFIEHTFVPEDPIDEEFTSFSVRIDLKASDPVNIPQAKNFRAIATI